MVITSTESAFDFGKSMSTYFHHHLGLTGFFSGIATKEGQERLRALKIKEQLDNRYELSMDEYEQLLKGSSLVKFGTRNVALDAGFIPQARSCQQREVLFLTEIKEYHRRYEWVS